MARATIKNKERLRSLLKNLPQAQRLSIRNELIAGGNQIVGMMKQLAPVHQGSGRAPAPYLRDSIKSETGDANLSAYASVRGRARVQDPALTVIISAGNSVGGGERRSDAHLQEYGTSSNPAQPFFHPSMRANRKEVSSRVKRAVRKAIKDALRGRGIA